MGTTFEVGEKAVYPAHGVGEILEIETKEIAGKKMEFYILNILDKDMTIMVPVEKAEEVGLRKIIVEDDVRKVYDILRERGTKMDISAWNKRYRAYLQKIKTGSVFEIAEVLRDLFVLKKEKTLSFGEKKMLETARDLLKKEISISKQVEEAQIERDFTQIFG
ncbi:MAG: CarD family transcriptional regulator [Deltaproteobacteria bacterium RIFOXYA12_FULL_61_11]|nr:MAG: CarD family transcriptional regulator [Deltaproteobacteria bacterium RIFOXYA12_FULL_61_11]